MFRRVRVELARMVLKRRLSNMARRKHTKLTEVYVAGVTSATAATDVGVVAAVGQALLSTRSQVPYRRKGIQTGLRNA